MLQFWENISKMHIPDWRWGSRDGQKQGPRQGVTCVFTQLNRKEASLFHLYAVIGVKFEI